MSWLYGLLGIHETQYDYVSKLGQQLVFDATSQYLERVNRDLVLAQTLFVQEVTEAFQERYLLPGGGYMQARGGIARSGAVKAIGSWDVAYPLLDWGDQLSITDVALAYMSPAEYQTHVDTILVRAANTARREILIRLFNNTSYNFVDPIRGSLTIQPLANGDSTLFPPRPGTDVEATANNYLTTTYAAGAISNTNNPYATIAAQFVESGNTIVFINVAQAPLTKALAGFIPVTDIYTSPGANISTLIGVPNLPGNANVIGRTDDCWIATWSYVPAGYMLAVQADQPAPLKQRVDPAGTGLARGLALVSSDLQYPLVNSEWRWRFGIGTANRLNGVVLQLRGDASAYEPPSAYATI